jgi:hypothetical protein
LTQILKDHGYDAVVAKEVGGISDEVGGNQVVVFDPSKVAVVA